MTPSPDIQLRNALRSLACAPQAQRRYVQLGSLRPAIETVDRLGGGAGALDLDAAVAPLVAELRERLARALADDPGFLEEAAADRREYLFGTALENERWSGVRQLARRAYSAYVGGPQTAAARTVAMVGRLPQPAAGR